MLTNFCCAAAGSGAANAMATAAHAAASPKVFFLLPKVCLKGLLIQTPFEDFPRENTGVSGGGRARAGERGVNAPGAWPRRLSQAWVRVCASIGRASCREGGGTE